MDEMPYKPPDAERLRSMQKDVIDPKELIAELSVQDLNYFANEYYRRLPFPDHQLGKPFTIVSDTAQVLHRLGLLLEGLRLGPAMTVFDFGAGTCWLAKMVWQMGCSVIATDVSKDALEMGRRLFEEYPVPMLNPEAPYRIVPFDGFSLQIENQSVDRIICFDTFHHVPNQEDVVAEFARVLRPGGIIALNEPIGPHSAEVASQSEMRIYTVLENDLRLENILDLFEEHGLAHPRFKLAFSPDFELGLEDYRQFTGTEVLTRDEPKPATETSDQAEEIRSTPPVSDRILRSVFDRSIGSVLFYLQNGEGIGDSRRAEGLSHEIEVLVDEPLELKVNELIHIELRARNTGSSYWIHHHPEGVGMVKAGTQLLDRDHNILVFDLDRGIFTRDVYPGETAVVPLPIRVDRPGEFTIGIDLVSDHITWFKNQGSKPLYLDVTIRE
jgi:SAM-dependent methyltransferase